MTLLSLKVSLPTAEACMDIVREDRQAQLTNVVAMKGLIPSEPLALKSPVATYGGLV
jgi:hypothetical protein